MPKRRRGRSHSTPRIHCKIKKCASKSAEIGEGSPSSPFRLPLRTNPNNKGCYFCPSAECFCKYFTALLQNIYRKISVKRIDMRYRQPHLCAKSVLPEFVSRLITLANIQPGEIFVDLGCGNGSVLFQVAAVTGVRCIGVELDPHNFDVASHALVGLRPDLEKKWSRPLHIELINDDLCKWIAHSQEIFSTVSVIWAANLLMPKPVNHFLSQQLRKLLPDSRVFCFEDLYPHSRSLSRIRDPDAFEKFSMKDYRWQPSSVEWCDIEDRLKRTSNHLMLFLSSADNRAHLVSLKSKTIVRTYSAFPASPYGIVFSPRTKHVVIHQENGCSAFFGFHTQQVLQRSFTAEAIRSSAVTSCGSFMIGGGENGNIFIWSVYTGQLIRIFSGHFRCINCLQCSSDNSVVITCSDDSTCKVWLLSSLTSLKIGVPNPLTVFTRHTLSVTSCAFLNETKLAITGSVDKTCKVFHTLSGKEQLTFSIGEAITYVIGAGHIAAVGTENGCIHLIHLYDNEKDQIAFLVINCNSTSSSASPVVFMSFHADDPSLLLVALRNGFIRSYSALNGAPREEILNIQKSIYSVCYVTEASQIRQKEVKLNKNPLDLSMTSYIICGTQSNDFCTASLNRKRSAAEEKLISEVQELEDLKYKLSQKLRSRIE